MEIFDYTWTLNTCNLAALHLTIFFQVASCSSCDCASHSTFLFCNGGLKSRSRGSLYIFFIELCCQNSMQQSKSFYVIRSYNMDTSALPDMYARSLRAAVLRVYISHKVVAKQRLCNLGSKSSVHLMSTMFLCYI